MSDTDQGAICSVCNRPLSDPLSISIGIGPECRRSVAQGTTKAQKQGETPDTGALPCLHRAHRCRNPRDGVTYLQALIQSLHHTHPERPADAPVVTGTIRTLQGLAARLPHQYEPQDWGADFEAAYQRREPTPQGEAQALIECGLCPFKRICTEDPEPVMIQALTAVEKLSGLLADDDAALIAGELRSALAAFNLTATIRLRPASPVIRDRGWQDASRDGLQRLGLLRKKP